MQLLPKIIRKLSLLALSGCLIFSLCSCTPKTAVYSNNNIFFDTVVTLTVYDPDHVELMHDCFDMATKYENLFSRTIPDSDISKINNAHGNYVEVSDETIDLLRIGIKYSELSNGKFDITVGKLSDTWNFKENTGTIPDDLTLQSALDTVGYEKIQIDGNKVALTDPNTMIDLGGIAKGYIADKMKEYLVSQNVTSAIINLGGNVLLIGGKTDGSLYQIGIQKPFEETGTPIATIDIKDCSLVSSGVYERYFTVDDTIYHHILDTDTGLPIDNGLYGVTIISEQSVDGDALSTTIFALGIDEGLKLIESLDNTEAVFVTDELEIITSSGINKTIPFHIIE